MFTFLREFGFNLVMFWPPFESTPAPIGKAEHHQLLFYRDLVERARRKGLEVWVAQTPNCTVRPEIAAIPVEERHLYPYRVDVRLDDSAARDAYLAHRSEMQKILNNADAYVTIDGDPGSYPDAKPQAFVDVLLADRANIDRHGTHPSTQKIIPWLWSGWGADWEKNGLWNEPIELLNRPLLEEIKRVMREPWELMPGRSHRDDWANGRTNFALAEEAGLISQSVLLTYELIEFEPTPPGITIQFDHIRRVFRQEKELIARARGIMGNAQQPITALPNLYFFGRAAQDWTYLERSDDEVLRDLAKFLGGDPELLIPAWDCLRRGLQDIPDNLPERLIQSTLQSVVAAHLPGGPACYLKILAAYVKVRTSILQECEAVSSAGFEAHAETVCQCLAHAYEWWLLNRYVYSGDSGSGFRLKHVQSELLAPLITWLADFDGESPIDEGVQLFATKMRAPEEDTQFLATDLRTSLTPLRKETHVAI